MAKLNPVVHQNFVSEEHNEEVFCKKLHKVIPIEEVTRECMNCDYLYGTLQGFGVECGWEDDSSEPVVAVTNPREELLRVSKLIDEDIIQKG